MVRKYFASWVALKVQSEWATSSSQACLHIKLNKATLQHDHSQSCRQQYLRAISTNNDMNSVERGKQPKLYGFQAAASFIASDPDGETYVFRKFDELTARDLVYLQCELIELESQFKEIDRKAGPGSNDPQFVLSNRHWETLRVRARDVDGDERKLMSLAKEIRAKLREYHEALLQARDVAQLKNVSKRVLKAYKHEFDQMDFRGCARTMLDDEADLVALKPALDGDLLSNTVRNHWPWTSSEHSPGSGEHRIAHYQERHLHLLVSFISVLIATVLLVVSIVVLYVVRSPDARLGLLILFIMLFGICIRYSTSASRDSIFAATAAYAAVLVVFVSGDLGNANRGNLG